MASGLTVLVFIKDDVTIVLNEQALGERAVQSVERRLHRTGPINTTTESSEATLTVES
jgi:hypothetical protein